MLFRSQLGPKLTRDLVLEFNLKSAKAKDPEVRVQLQADNGVNYGEVARAMASIERAGITKLSVITAK